jgi:2,3-bisphosphoglycerate-dependent phosphoglycerate mutase
MPERVFLVRHCAAAGQAPDAPLTAEGRAQALALAGVLAGRGIDRIISSPFLRARQSIEPLAQRLGLTLRIDDRLAERALGDPGPLPWRDAVRLTFDDFDRCFPGGESSRDATGRAVAALDDALASGALCPVLVTHGNLLSLLLRYVDGGLGYAEWERLRTPDVFEATLGNGDVRLSRRII